MTKNRNYFLSYCHKININDFIITRWSEDIKEKGIKGLIVCVNENTDVEHLKEQLTPLANLGLLLFSLHLC